MRRLALSLLSASAAVAVLGIASAPAGATVTSTCLPATSPVFASVGDTHPYFLVPGGAFEAGTPPWTLVGGATRVVGGGPLSNAMSLSLPSGSSATSPTVCVTPISPSIRFYVRNTGSSTSKLAVTVLYTLPSGNPASLQVAQVSGNGVWQPTPAINFLVNMLSMTSPTGTTNVAFKFRPLDTYGQWRIDDVYVDPFKRT